MGGPGTKKFSDAEGPQRGIGVFRLWVGFRVGVASGF